MRFASVTTTLLLGIAACSSSTTSADPVDGGGTLDAASSSGQPGANEAGADSSPSFPDDHGPGIYGALPSGYCCTKDAECKGRKCQDLGGGKMCLDPCADASNCDVPKTPFECRTNGSDTVKRCSPPAGVKCVPAADFVRGKKAPGECCDFANGQAGGADCASHVCGSFGDNLPYVCTSRCESDVDCLADYKCETSGGSASFIATCLPRAVYTGGSYTCK